MIHHLVISDIKKSFIHFQSIRHVLSGISYHFESNKTYCITGASGVGKSTLLHIIAGFDTPTSGSVLLKLGDKVYKLDDNKQFFYQKIGFIFQAPYLLNDLTVLENCILKGLITGQSYEECFSLAQVLLEKIGLLDKQNSFPPMLSGGEQQRVSLVRALCNKPYFVCADEPTSNLDEITGKAIMDLVHTCQRLWGFGLIVCSHDAYVADTMEVNLRLEDGKLNTVRTHSISALQAFTQGERLPFVVSEGQECERRAS